MAAATPTPKKKGHDWALIERVAERTLHGTAQYDNTAALMIDRAFRFAFLFEESLNKHKKDEADRLAGAE